MDGRPETRPLLPSLVSPVTGTSYESVILSNDTFTEREHYDEKSHHFYPWQQQTPTQPGFSLRNKFIFIMVAIPSFLAASAAVRSFGSHQPRDASSQSDSFGSIVGPVVSVNFPDPAIIYENGVSYAFATNNKGVGGHMIHVQMATSTDNQTWTLLNEDALPQVGAWENGRGVWAPDVVKVADGTFVLYYADATTWSPEHHCVGVATSPNVTGPYVPSDQPWACPDVATVGGAIDPDGFHDLSTDRHWVTYKVDGNSNGHGGLCKNMVEPIMPTPIMLQEVQPDGVTKIGDPIQILDRDQLDGPLIEAPTLYRSDEGVYFIFFSSNCFTTPRYDTSYATSDSITGPYVKSNRPLLVTGDGPDLVGPGGLDIIPGGTLASFHGHMTFTNSQVYKESIISKANSLKKPIKDINTPLVRGMYTGVLTFTGRDVSLVKQ
jgi:hypothetical protein